MKSLRQAIRQFAFRCDPPPPPNIASHIRSLASKLICPLNSPFAVSQLIKRLDPERGEFEPPYLDLGHISGWGQILMFSDGTYSFKGHVHDSGPTGYNYAFLMIFLDVQDSSGKTVVVAHSGSVHGTFDIGKRNDDWQDPSALCLFAEKWELVKASRIIPKIHTSVDPLDVLEHIIAGVLIGLGIDAVVIWGPSAVRGWKLSICVGADGSPGICLTKSIAW